MPMDFRRDAKHHQGRGRESPPMRRGGPPSRSRSPLLRLHHERNQKEARGQREEQRVGFYDSFSRERKSREEKRTTGFNTQEQGQRASLRMDTPPRRTPRSRSRSRNRGGEHHVRYVNTGKKQSPNSSSVFVGLDRAVKRAREIKDAGKGKVERWGHSGFKELYPSPQSKRENTSVYKPPNHRHSSRSRSHSPLLKQPRKPAQRSRSRSTRRRLLPPRRSSLIQNHNLGRDTHDRTHGLKSVIAPKRSSGIPPPSRARGTLSGSKPESKKRQSEIAKPRPKPKNDGTHESGKKAPVSSAFKATVISQTSAQKSTSKISVGKETSKPVGTKRPTRETSSSSEFGSRTPSPELRKKKQEQKEPQPQRVTTKSRNRSSSDNSSSDDDVLSIHADNRARSLSPSLNSSTDEDNSGSDEHSRRKSPISSTESEMSDEPKKTDSNTNTKSIEKNGEVENEAKKGTKSKVSGSDSGSESTSEDEEPRMTLSERFAKLTQMSRDKREFAKPEISIDEIDTKLKVVKDFRNSATKVYVNQAPSRPTVARTRPTTPDLNTGDIRYASEDRRRHFERMTRDEPRERDRPEDWSDVRVRYNYYKTRGYFDERPLTLEEYSKWESWWYAYRDWLADEGYYDNQSPGNTYAEPLSPRNRDLRESKPWQHQRQAPPSLFEQRISPPAPLLGSANRNGRAPMYTEEPVGNRIPISRRIGPAPGGSLMVSVPMSARANSMRGRGRLAGRIGFRRN